MKTQGYTIIEVLIVAFILTCGVTWLTNAVRLFQCDFEPSYKAEVCYAVGLVTPTCLITAFMDIED